MRRAVLLIPLAALALAGCGEGAAASQAPRTHTITVKFEVSDSSGDDVILCDQGGSGGYSDIGPGTDVTVYDGSGKVIATAPLGTDCEQPPTSDGGATDISDATWTTIIRNVPDASFYQVEVGNRGKLRFSKSELAGDGWTVSASLGS